MKLKEIISGIHVVETIGDTDKDIQAIHIDSRKIEPGHLFVAVKGTQTDGHVYIDKAIEKGASAIVCETLPGNLHKNIIYIKVENNGKPVSEIHVKAVQKQQINDHAFRFNKSLYPNAEIIDLR